MRMDKLTSRFQQALSDAQSLAVGRDHNLIEPVHLLVALIDQQGGSTKPLLVQSGVNVAALRQRLGEVMDKLPKVSGQEGNGIRINGTRRAQSQLINGDVIELGKARITFATAPI